MNYRRTLYVRLLLLVWISSGCVQPVGNGTVSRAAEDAGETADDQGTSDSDHEGPKSDQTECPCEIGGVCYQTGDRNPLNDCQMCDPGQSADRWSLRSPNSACNDANACTTNDQCNENGLCVGTEKNCPAPSSCETAFCNAQTGECESEVVANGTPCDPDGYDCTTDVCRDGVCEHTVEEGSCAIDGRCATAGEQKENGVCDFCDPDKDKTAWSRGEAGRPCTTFLGQQSECGPFGGCIDL